MSSEAAARKHLKTWHPNALERISIGGDPLEAGLAKGHPAAGLADLDLSAELASEVTMDDLLSDDECSDEDGCSDEDISFEDMYELLRELTDS